MNGSTNNPLGKTPVKILLLLLLTLALAALIFCGRLVWFHQGIYWGGDVPPLDEEEIAPPPIDYQPIKDRPVMGDGRVVFDLSHDNNLHIDDLAPLHDRLQARGAAVEMFSGGDESLQGCLHRATALVVVAPTMRYTASERDAIADFVNDGGLLLLAADPTYVVPQPGEEEFPSLYSALFPTSATPAINSLANRFGITYFDDYLYNLKNNAGNYRNVRFTTLDAEHALTKDLDTLVLFSSHSLSSNGTPLVVGDANTQSPVRTGETNLAAVVLSADGRVLALGDITFLTAPYHTVADNDRFLSNIADWLAIDGRIRQDLTDFPYLFKGPVDLVQISGDFIDPQIIVSGGQWQRQFQQEELILNLRAEADPNHDAVLVGTFDDLETVETYLAKAGITITVAANTQPPQDIEEEVEPTVTPEPEEEEEGTELEGEEGESPTEEPPAEEAPVETPEPEGEGKSEGRQGTIEIAGLGKIGIQGTTLYVLDRSDERTVVIILAEEIESAIKAVDRLIAQDLDGCLQADTVTVCSTGEAQKDLEAEEEGETTEEEEEEPPSGARGRIFILSDDNRASEGTRTSAAEFEAILSPYYEVTVWSIKQDGPPGRSDMTGYEVYIIDSGDYAFDLDNVDGLMAMQNIASGGVLLIGAQPLPSVEENYAPINDLQVSDDDHLLAAGFEPGEIITLSPSESGVPAVIMAEETEGTTEVSIVFTRGPGSPETGAPAIVTAFAEGEAVDRAIIAAFTFHRLPPDAQQALGLNAVAWLMGAEG